MSAAARFDVLGRIVAEERTIGSVTKTFSYGYNLDGTLKTMTYPVSKRIINYQYNAAEQPTQAQQDPTQGGFYFASSATYAAQGALASVVNGQTGTFGGVTYSLGYNNRLWPSSISASSSNGTALSLSYSYFANGNVNVITNNRDNGRTVTYGYDSLNRISSASTQATSGADCWGQAVPSTGYDRYANLLTINATKCSAPSLSISVNGNNQVNGFSYDAAGDVINDGSYAYSWDAEGRMTAAGSTTYTYDGDGQRVKKSTGTLYWRGVDGSVLAETDTLGNTLNEYIFFGARIARRDSSGNVYYYFGSALGSATITNSSGSLCYDADFYPFGGELAFTNTCGQNYKFAGMEQDSETGDYHTWFRQYNPNQGRWLSPDPLAGDISNPQSLNRYAYVLNNPTTFIDPLGLQGDDSGFTGVDCRDPSYADSHAECQGPGSPWCFVNPNDPSCWYFPPPAEDGGGGGGGAGGSTGTAAGSTGTGTVTEETISEPVNYCGGTIVFGEDCPFPYGPEVNGVPSGLPFPGGGFGIPCDFGTCGGGVPGSGFQAGEIAVGYGAWELTKDLILAGLAYAGLRQAAAMGKGRSLEDVLHNCTPVGPEVREPATGVRYKGGTSIEQEFLCSDGPYTVHWIEVGGKIVHGPHARPGPPTGGAGP